MSYTKLRYVHSCYGPSLGIGLGGQGHAATRASVQAAAVRPEYRSPGHSSTSEQLQPSVVEVFNRTRPFLRPLSENEVVAARRCAGLRLP